MNPPPGIPPMPPMMYPPPPPPRKPLFGALARTIFTTLASLIVLGSISLNLYLLAYVAASSGSGIDVQTLEKGTGSDTIAIIAIEGMILDATVEAFDKMIQKVEDDASVKAVVLEIDTPGGAVTASDEIYDRIQRFRKDTSKPVIVSMQALATSGGYYIACAGDYIFAQKSTMTGNIGVMMARFNLAKWAQEHGIEDSSLHSTGSDFKTAGSMWKEETPEERAYIQGLIDEAFMQFKQVVREGRGPRLDPASQESEDEKVARIANGKVYMASEAHRLGLIDAIGYRHDALEYAKQAAGISSPRIVRYSQPKGPSFFIGFNVALRGSEASGPLNMQVDAKLLEQFTRPRLMYLWRVH